MSTTVNPWALAVAGFEENLADSDRSPTTNETYVKHVRWLADSIDCDPWNLRPSQLGAWLDDHNWSVHTRRKVLISLRFFYVWGITTGQIERSPLAGLPAVTSKASGPKRIQATPLWEEPIELFLKSLEAGGRAAGTIAQRRIWLVNASHTFADPWQVTYADLVDYLSRPDWRAEYKRHGRSSLRRFYGWAVRCGLTAQDPTLDLEAVRLPRALPRPTPDENVMDGVAAADDRTRLAMELAMFAGLRIGEVAQLRLSDIGGDSVLIHGKGGRDRIVPLHPDLQTSLHAEVSRRRQLGEESPWLFPSTHGDHLSCAYLGKKITAALGGGWTTHTLRHRFATRAYAATHDLRAVQELLGHSKPETTARYAAVPDGALRAAVAGVGTSPHGAVPDHRTPR